MKLKSKTCQYNNGQTFYEFTLWPMSVYETALMVQWMADNPLEYELQYCIIKSSDEIINIKPFRWIFTNPIDAMVFRLAWCEYEESINESQFG